MALAFEAKPPRSSQGFLRHLQWSSKFTLLAFSLLNGCSLLIGDLPGPVESHPDAEANALPILDAGGDDSVGDGADASDASATDAPDASMEAAAPIVDGALQEPDCMKGPDDDTPVLEDAAPSSVEDFPDATPAPPTDSGAITVDAESDPCDRDEDGEPSETCGGGDCADDDPDVHPGQARYFVESHDRVGFDYDCSGLIERDPSEPSVSCSLELAGCDSVTQGFIGDTLPACGEFGDWGQCVREDVAGLPSGCTAQKLEERRAGCR